MKAALSVRAALCAGAVVASSGCEGSLDGPAPTISELAPALICQERRLDEETAVALRGSGLTPVPVGLPDDAALALPSVSLVHARDLDGDEGKGSVTWFRGEPGALDGGGRLAWISDEEMTLFVTRELEAALVPGLYDVGVESKNGKRAARTSALAIVAPPSVVDVEPAIACLGSPDEVVLVRARGAPQVGGALPLVRLGEAAVAPSAALGCRALAFDGADVELCDTLVVDLADVELAPGFASVALEGEGGCRSDPALDGVELLLVEAPRIEAVEPDGLCRSAGASVELVVRGRGFLRVGARDVEVRVGDREVAPWGFGRCTPLSARSPRVAECRSFHVTLDANDLPLGPVTVEVTSPVGASCRAAASAVLVTVDPPRVDAVFPAELCSGAPSTLTVDGADLERVDSVVVGGRSASSIVVEPGGARLAATFDDGLPAGSHDVELLAGGACAASAHAPVVVRPTQEALLVDPPVIFQALDVDVTVLTPPLGEPVAFVKLTGAAGDVTPVPASSELGLGKVAATVPSGLGTGSYDVRLVSTSGCESREAARLVVTADESIALSHVRPSYASSAVDTAVVVHAAPAAAFEAGARAWVRHTESGAARELRAPLATSPHELSAVVAPGLAAGRYDVVVVNPSGSAGVLPSALAVAPREPPRISSLRPRSLAASGISTLLVEGAGFDEDPTRVGVRLDCIDLSTGEAVAAPSVAVETASSTTLRLSVFAGAVAPSAVCGVTVVNADGSAALPHAFSLRDPAEPIGAWASGAPMLERRRGHALVVARGPAGRSWLYAIGGDGGASSDVKSSIEAAPVDALGRMGAWAPQRHTLVDVGSESGPVAAPRAFAGAAAIGRFVYLVGGEDERGPTSTLLRAELLDERAAPRVSDSAVIVDEDGAGLAPGPWSWRVSAVFDDDHDDNPGGESLPGESVTLEIPSGSLPLAVALSWPGVAGARGYRVYRTTSSSLPGAPFALVGEPASGQDTTLVDGGLPADPSLAPLDVGALGRWHIAGGTTLVVARSHHATVVVPDPTFAERAFLYAIGGRGSGGVLAALERASVVAGSVGPFTPLSATLTPARADLAAFSVTHDDASVVAPGEAYLFVTGGAATSQTVRDVEAARIEPDGDALSFTAVLAPSPARAGAAAFTANGAALLVGGSNGSDVTAALTSPAPSLGTWTPLVRTLLMSRVHMGSASDGLFLFVTGGEAGGEPASSSVERNVR